MLFPLQKPVFVGSSMVRARGRRFAQEISSSRLPSVEPLSTRRNSRFCQVWFARDSKQSSSSLRPFQFTTITETNGSRDSAWSINKLRNDVPLLRKLEKWEAGNSSIAWPAAWHRPRSIALKVLEMVDAPACDRGVTVTVGTRTNFQ